MAGEKKFHPPVLVEEVVSFLNLRAGAWILDATVGDGGHALVILNQGGKVLGVDRDPEAMATARQRLAAYGNRLVLKQGRFSKLRCLAKEAGIARFSGILFDLGVSSHQLKEPRRGFSFRLEGPLDMRMDPSLAVTAADLINGLGKDELSKLFSKLGEERHSRRLANAIIKRRRLKPVRTTGELAGLIRETVGWRRGQLHPATQVFLALRLAVNDELNELKKGLGQVEGLLKTGGRVVVISFHSLEDRIVKDFFKKQLGLETLTRKPVRPREKEVALNPQARSAKLRAAEKLAAD
jgi:16S rRNA (cytosine1402-N4)-methyltransferase